MEGLVILGAGLLLVLGLIKERQQMRVTPRFRRHSQLMAVLVVVLGILALGSWLGRVVPEPVVTITIPIGNQRSLILMAAYRAIADDPVDPLVPHAVQPTFHELRLGVGDDDRARETYVQLLDLTVPLWP